MRIHFEVRRWRHPTGSQGPWGGGPNPPGTLQEAYRYDAYGRQTVITNSGGTVKFDGTDTRTAGGSSTINGSPYMYTDFSPEVAFKRADRPRNLTHEVILEHRAARIIRRNRLRAPGRLARLRLLSPRNATLFAG